ncbi:transmembrane protein 87A [Ischnura elegans]|uniref:transmembrane protein 87A n=1 Tax=Ischnura elegans TaxID=197161 RepID=UPI001ED87811|nr:transmembrane protein 87A [Ischnura elegans]
MIMSFATVSCLLFLLNAVITCVAFPDAGKWDETLSNKLNSFAVPKSLYKGSQVFIDIICDSDPPGEDVSIGWRLLETACWEDYLHIGDRMSNNDIIQNYATPHQTLGNRTLSFVESPMKNYKCSGHIILDEMVQELVPPAAREMYAGKSENPLTDEGFLDEDKMMSSKKKRDEGTVGGAKAKLVKIPSQNVSSVKIDPNHPRRPAPHPVFTITKDGVYLLVLKMNGEGANFNASVHVEMMGTYGYLSALDWPLLPFYGIMCLIYVAFGLAWLIVSFCQWRDLLRIQFWIGGVIFLGMLEKATFYAEYQRINSTGESIKAAVLVAELVSCAKRTLARMLVIIVSLGFGIVKPRLGPMLHRVMSVGIVYLVIASVESFLRVLNPKNDPSSQVLLASAPLALVDSAICWWIFTSLVQTTRTLRLRRNLVKLSLYRHFTNTLIFAVISSVIFMLYSIKAHRLAMCLTDWKELWVDEAYWHILFSLILLVIMFLWRPTNNNQRYAFTPLLDAPEDEEEEPFINDAFGVKMRGMRSNSPKPKSNNSPDDDLKWVEQHIPSSLGDTPLPILDSEEEIVNTKFEVSKMQ